jgi:hypothetical protein
LVMRRPLLLAALLALLLPALAVADQPGLEIVHPENVALTREDGVTEDASIWVRNSTLRPAHPEFAAVVEDGDGDKTRYTAEVVNDAGTPVPTQVLDGETVARYRLFLRAGRQSRKDVSGQLTVTGAGSPGSVELSITGKSFADRGVTGALAWPVLPAFLLIVLAGVVAIRRNNTRLDSPLPPDLNFKESFASTVTVAGALLATILAASVLPDETTGLSKEAFVALNLIFGIGVVVAGLVYAALQRAVWVPVKDDPKKEQRKMQGSVWGFLVASFITVWAVFGELFVVLQLLEELGQDQGFNSASLVLLRILVGLAALTMAVYTVRRTPAIVASERGVERREDKRSRRRRARHEEAVRAGVAAPTAAAPRSVSLL